jgi:hypothetical protein
MPSSIIRTDKVEFEYFDINQFPRPVLIRGSLTVSNYPDERQLAELSIESCVDFGTNEEVDPNIFNQDELRARAYFSLY